MASCFKQLFPAFVLMLVVSCGQDGVAPGLSGQTKHIFATNTSYTGNLGGVAGADAKCMSDAIYPGSGTYKAFVSDGTNRRACSTAFCSGGISENIDWVLAPDTEYYRLSDGTLLGTTNASGVFTSDLAVSPNPASDAWVGMLDYASDSWDCSDWTAGNSGTTGRYNTSNTLNPGSGLGGAGCNNTMSIICVEQ